MAVPGKAAAELVAEGFSVAEIAALERVARGYPWAEWCESAREWRALQFLRWRVRRGLLEGDTDG